MIIRSTLATVAVSALLSFSVPVFADTTAHSPQIAFSAAQLYPETASWSDKEKVFFVSSVRHGTVGKVTLDGKYMPFITDDQLVSTVGLLADDAHNTLWVTNSDPGAPICSSVTISGSSPKCAIGYSRWKGVRSPTN